MFDQEELKSIMEQFEQKILHWAYSTEGDLMQDWSLIVSGNTREELLLQLAADLQCPKREFFLDCLYIFTGDFVRVSCGGARVPPPIEPLLAQAETLTDPAIQLWVKRSRELIAHPEQFDPEFWYEGGHAEAQA